MSDADETRQTRERIEALERVVAELIGWPTQTYERATRDQWSRIADAPTPSAAVREKAAQLDSRESHARR